MGFGRYVDLIPSPHSIASALVVGLAGEALTTDRDHRVKLQFPWQRGAQPLPGGLSHDESSADGDGNAPGTDASGTWVRVALPSAGANWGAVLVPRIGTEVMVGFVEGDIDRPIVLGQLYNGQDTPPFAAGVDSGVNHAGVISGLHTHALDRSGFNQWVLDDAPGQLRMRMLTSYAQAELGLGHLIAQDAGSAQRGAWRGAGFEATTQGWTSVRAARGLLVSTSARPGSYGSAQGVQMEASEALAQLRAAGALGQRLGDAAQAAAAHPLASFRAGQALEQLADGIDPKKLGRHEGSVNGQAAGKKAQSAIDMVEKVRKIADKHIGEALAPVQRMLDAAIHRLEMESLVARSGILDAKNVHFRGTLVEARAVTLMRDAEPPPKWLSKGRVEKWAEQDLAKGRKKVVESRKTDPSLPDLTDTNIKSFHAMAAVEIKGPTNSCA